MGKDLAQVREVQTVLETGLDLELPKEKLRDTGWVLVREAQMAPN
jgi:hypothetical protein